jgi:hypothetical protein
LHLGIDLSEQVEEKRNKRKTISKANPIYAKNTGNVCEHLEGKDVREISVRSINFKAIETVYWVL